MFSAGPRAQQTWGTRGQGNYAKRPETAWPSSQSDTHLVDGPAAPPLGVYPEVRNEGWPHGSLSISTPALVTNAPGCKHPNPASAEEMAGLPPTPRVTPGPQEGTKH